MESLAKLKHNTPKAMEFVDSFQGTLDKLTRTDNLPPGMAVTIMANMNFHGQDMPSDVFGRLDYGESFETPEDPVVLGEAFKRIQDGKVRIDRTVRTGVGGFRLQYNFVRGFRPKRGARRVDIPLDLPFDPKKFNYAQSVCDPELFKTGTYGDMPVDILFNRYPFAPLHFLWIPGRKTLGHNQYLDDEKDAAIIEAMWTFVMDEGLGEDVRLCYNSNGAHASVNHLHGQGFFVTEDWEPPLERMMRKSESEILGVVPEEGWVPSGEKVPVKGVVYKWDRSGAVDCYFPGTRWLARSDGVSDLKAFIGEMNARYRSGEKVAYSFCMSPSGVVCFPRKHQGDERYFSLLEKSPFTTGYAFFEMLGEIISPTKDIPLFDRDRIEKQILELYKSASIV